MEHGSILHGVALTCPMEHGSILRGVASQNAVLPVPKTTHKGLILGVSLDPGLASLPDLEVFAL